MMYPCQYGKFPPIDLRSMWGTDCQADADARDLHANQYVPHLTFLGDIITCEWKLKYINQVIEIINCSYTAVCDSRAFSYEMTIPSKTVAVKLIYPVADSSLL